jgi:tetratricopeptide (TPR) repeat protein
MVVSRFSRILPAALLLVWLPVSALAAPANVQDANQAFRQGNNSAALDKINAFLAANPNDAQGRFLKGLILTELNRRGDAIKVFTTLTEDYPELPEPYNNLAVLYAAQGQYDQAKNSLEMAIRTHPSYATAHENLGDIYAKMASQSYDKALQLDKSNTSAQTKLSLIRDLFSPTRSQETVKTKAGKPAAPEHAVAVAKAEPPAEPAKPVTATKPAETTKPVEASTPTEAAKPVETAKPAAAEVATTSVKAPEKAAAPTSDKAAAKFKAAIESTLHAWAKAWSRKDADAYLAFYGANYQVPGGHERAAWETERRDRIKRPRFIKIELSDIQVAIEGQTARVSFVQRYKSNTYKDREKKSMTLEKQGETWKIVEES